MRGAALRFAPWSAEGAEAILNAPGRPTTTFTPDSSSTPPHSEIIHDSQRASPHEENHPSPGRLHSDYNSSPSHYLYAFLFYYQRNTHRLRWSLTTKSRISQQKLKNTRIEILLNPLNSLLKGLLVNVRSRAHFGDQGNSAQLRVFRDASMSDRCAARQRRDSGTKWCATGERDEMVQTQLLGTDLE